MIFQRLLSNTGNDNYTILDRILNTVYPQLSQKMSLLFREALVHLLDTVGYTCALISLFFALLLNILHIRVKSPYQCSW